MIDTIDKACIVAAMYSIGQVIYGYPLTAELQKRHCIEDLIEDEGCLHYYSGSASAIPAAIGVELCEFDEATDYIPVIDLKLAPTNEQKTELDEKWALLSDAVKRNVMKAFPGGPFTFILWSTS